MTSRYGNESDRIVNKIFSLVKRAEKTSAQQTDSSDESGTNVSLRGNQVSGASEGNNFVGQAASGLNAIANIVWG